jgi:hypothetical protein
MSTRIAKLPDLIFKTRWHGKREPMLAAVVGAFTEIKAE